MGTFTHCAGPILDMLLVISADRDTRDRVVKVLCDELLAEIVTLLLKRGMLTMHHDIRVRAAELLDHIATTRGDGVSAWAKREASCERAETVTPSENELHSNARISVGDEQDIPAGASSPDRETATTDEQHSAHQDTSGMPDLGLISTMDMQDDDSEEPAGQKRCTSQRIETIKLPDIDVVFCVPTDTGIVHKSLKDFPSSVSNIIVESFNRNYLFWARDRIVFQKIVENKKMTGGCLLRHLLGVVEESTPSMTSCWECQESEDFLCTRLETSNEGRSMLAIYPLDPLVRREQDWHWQSVGFWMHLRYSRAGNK